MIACHHEEVRALSFNQRFMCEELSRIASLRISALLAVEAERQRGRLHAAGILSPRNVRPSVLQPRRASFSILAALRFSPGKFKGGCRPRRRA